MTNASFTKGVKGYLPMRPDLLHFVQFRENLAPDEPLLIPGKGFFSNYLAELIEFGKCMYFPGAVRMAPENPALTGKLRFIASPGLLDETFFEYADQVAARFNKVVYHALLEDEVRYVQVATTYDTALDAREALEHFRISTKMDHYRESDADIKANYRLRLSRGLVRHKPRAQRAAV
jgi:hypothetical protein